MSIPVVAVKDVGFLRSKRINFEHAKKKTKIEVRKAWILGLNARGYRNRISLPKMIFTIATVYGSVCGS